MNNFTLFLLDGSVVFDELLVYMKQVISNLRNTFNNVSNYFITIYRL